MNYIAWYFDSPNGQTWTEIVTDQECQPEHLPSVTVGVWLTDVSNVTVGHYHVPWTRLGHLNNDLAQGPRVSNSAGGPCKVASKIGLLKQPANCKPTKNIKICVVQILYRLVCFLESSVLCFLHHCN